MIHIVSTRVAAPRLTLERAGETLTFNGDPIDFAPLAEGATMPFGTIPSPWINGPVTRAGGVLTVPICVPYAGGDLPESLWHPDPIIDPPDGPIMLPEWEWTKQF